jgi:hypothetical protein
MYNGTPLTTTIMIRHLLAFAPLLMVSAMLLTPGMQAQAPGDVAATDTTRAMAASIVVIDGDTTLYLDRTIRVDTEALIRLGRVLGERWQRPPDAEAIEKGRQRAEILEREAARGRIAIDSLARNARFEDGVLEIRIPGPDQLAILREALEGMLGGLEGLDPGEVASVEEHRDGDTTVYSVQTPTPATIDILLDRIFENLARRQKSEANR